MVLTKDLGKLFLATLELAESMLNVSLRSVVEEDFKSIMGCAACLYLNQCARSNFILATGGQILCIL